MLMQKAIEAIIFSGKQMACLGRRLFPKELQVGSVAALLTLAITHNAMAIPAQGPVFLSIAAKPHVNLIMSKDEELFRKAYNDYSNLDGHNAGIMSMADTTYRNDFEYYGYFDPNWCYSYSNNAGSPGLSYFTPSTAAGTGSMVHKCANNAINKAWSGNFLNWSTMTRIDIIRRVMFGGKRSVDTASQAILERAYLPKDIHAFVKIYAGSDMVDLTPYTYNAASQPAISLCNVSTNTPAASGYPLIRIAIGAWQQWSASEKQQCQYNVGGAIPTAPTTGLDLTAKVEACVTTKEGPASIRCEKYGANYKPKGILQTFGEAGNLKFSLITGSYKGHLSGGVLRRAASLIAGNVNASGVAVPSLDEIDLTTGQFNSSVNGIIKNINSFVIEGYSFSANSGAGLYADCNTHSIPVATVKAGTTANQTCSDWGNPLSEIYLEALRYITGRTSPVAAFNVDDTTAFGTSSGYTPVAGLTNATWGTDPWPADQWCAKCSTIILSTGANSFDGDQLGSVTDLGLSLSALNTNYTDVIGTQEAALTSTPYPRSLFVGGTTVGQTYCKPTTINSLSDPNLLGICPEQPAMQGTYAIAGLAYWAHINDIRPGSPGKQTLTTYAVDLAESLPSFSVPVSGTNVTFLPACLAQPGGGNWQSCTLIDVKVESLTPSTGNPTSGSYLMFWEDSLWGNDYDFDGASRIQFCVGAACTPAIGANQIKITNSVPYANAGNNLQFSYNITGVGPSVTINSVAKQSSTPVNTPSTLTTFPGGLLTPWAQRPGSQNFDRLKAAPDAYPDTVTTVTSTFTVSSSSATSLLQKPLYYAAKYGGFTESDPASSPSLPNLVTEWDNKGGVADGVPDNYFSVKNPAELETSLNLILSSIVGAIATASSVATNTTQLAGGAFIYQAQFNSDDWSGALYSYAFDNNGVIGATPSHCTKTRTVAGVTCNGAMTTNSTGRHVYTYNGTTRTDFAWASLTAAQQANLQVAGDVGTTNAQNRVGWLLGDATNETAAGGLRSRGSAPDRNILGDIVDSSPVYIGDWDYGYSRLSGTAGSEYNAFVVKKKARVTGGGATLLVGANDGMVHAFDATSLAEVYAYVPNAVFPKLASITNPNYGGPGSPNPHTYTVDGSIAIGDVYIDNGGPTKEWRTIIVGTLGAGGRGIYALDVTDSYIITGATPHPFVAPKVLFEITQANYPQLGYVMGKPLIVPMKNGRWAAVFGNGDSSGGNSSLFVVDIEAPLDAAKTKVLDTGSGTGLSSPELLPNAKGEVESAYAGDLSGNVWKFNLSDATTPANWKKDYLLFAAKDGSGVAQPITAAPTLGLNASKGNDVMVYVGTGKYYDTTDSAASASPVQSFYAIADIGSTVARSTLKQKTLTTTGTTSRVVNESNPAWATQNGWYLDFSDTTGEKVTTKALLIQDKLIFPTLIPSAGACDHGGNSWLMEVVAVGDKYVGIHLLDHDVYNQFLVLGDLGLGLKSGTTGTIIGSGTDSTLINKDITLAGQSRRQSWRQLR